MSLSLRDELRVVLSRDQVLLIVLGRVLTLRGVSHRLIEKKSLPCAPESDPVWANAVSTLEQALAGLPGKPGCARVILSNHFTRYAMIPWNDGLSSEEEEAAYAKHCFSQLYGVTADSWDLKLSGDQSDAPQLASAVDGQLLQILRALFLRADIKLTSVQPCLMTAFNNSRASLQRQDAWFVMYEHGMLCLGLVSHGHWRSVRTLKVGQDWLEKLPEILDREIYLSESDTATDQMYLWAPDHWRDELPESRRWKIHKLQPVIRPGIAPGYDERFAMAMCG